MIKKQPILDVGLVIQGRRMVWGWHHGWGRKAPYWFTHGILTVWNAIACKLTGHEWLPEDLWSYEDGDFSREFPQVCVYCGKTRRHK